jgi:hypothetical protein
VVHALQADLERLKQRHSFEQATADMLRHKAQAMQQQKQAHHLSSTSSDMSALSPQQTNELPPSEPAAYELPGSNDDEGTGSSGMLAHMAAWPACLSTRGNLSLRVLTVDFSLSSLHCSFRLYVYCSSFRRFPHVSA